MAQQLNKEARNECNAKNMNRNQNELNQHVVW